MNGGGGVMGRRGRRGEEGPDLVKCRHINFPRWFTVILILLLLSTTIIISLSLVTQWFYYLGHVWNVLPSPSTLLFSYMFLFLKQRRLKSSTKCMYTGMLLFFCMFMCMFSLLVYVYVCKCWLLLCRSVMHYFCACVSILTCLWFLYIYVNLCMLQRVSVYVNFNFFSLLSARICMCKCCMGSGAVCEFVGVWVEWAASVRVDDDEALFTQPP